MGVLPPKDDATPMGWTDLILRRPSLGVKRFTQLHKSLVQTQKKEETTGKDICKVSYGLDYIWNHRGAGP